MTALRLRAVAVAVLLLLAGPALAASAAPTLVGTWRLNVTCKPYSYVNIVNIGRADARKILGTTNVDDAFGKIISGSFDGTAFQFKNTYLWNGKRHYEVWDGVLNRSGKSVKGTFVSDGDDPAARHCRFSGSRI